MQRKDDIEAVAKPASIAGMSGEELKRLKVGMVRKLDMVIMSVRIP
jgi:hypothetical protein